MITINCFAVNSGNESGVEGLANNSIFLTGEDQNTATWSVSVTIEVNLTILYFSGFKTLNCIFGRGECMVRHIM